MARASGALRRGIGGRNRVAVHPDTTFGKAVRIVRYEISWFQLTLMLVASKLSLFSTYGVVMVGQLPPSRDTWLAVLIAAAIGLLIALTAYALSARFPGKSFDEYTPIVFGPHLARLVNLALGVLYVHWAAISLDQFAFFLDSVVYFRTPEVVFSLFFLVLALIATREGPEFIARVATVAGLVTLAGVIFFSVILIPQTDFGSVKPFLGEGWEPVFRQALTPIGLFGEGAWITLVAAPYVSKLRHTVKALGVGTLINGAFTAFGTIIVIGIFGPELIGLIAFPTHTAARLVSLGGVFERLDWLVLVMWVGAMGVRIAFLTFGATQGLRGVVPRAQQRHAALVVMAAVFIWTRLNLHSLTEVLNLFGPSQYLRNALPLQLAPAFILLVAWLRRRRGEELPHEA